MTNHNSLLKSIFSLNLIVHIDIFEYMNINTTEDNIVRIAKALSDKTRLKILSEIAKRERITCSEAEKIAELSQPTVSHHLKILTDAGLLDVVKDGRYSIISINKNALKEFGDLINKAVLL